MNILKPPRIKTETPNRYTAKVTLQNTFKKQWDISNCIDESDDLVFSFDDESAERPHCVFGNGVETLQELHRENTTKKDSKNTSKPEKTKKTISLQQSNSIFDPHAASPASDFIRLLQLRMSVYYEQEVNIFS